MRFGCNQAVMNDNVRAYPWFSGIGLPEAKRADMCHRIGKTAIPIMLPREADPLRSLCERSTLR